MVLMNFVQPQFFFILQQTHLHVKETSSWWHFSFHLWNSGSYFVGSIFWWPVNIATARCPIQRRWTHSGITVNHVINFNEAYFSPTLDPGSLNPDILPTDGRCRVKVDSLYSQTSSSDARSSSIFTRPQTTIGLLAVVSLIVSLQANIFLQRWRDAGYRCQVPRNYQEINGFRPWPSK